MADVVEVEVVADAVSHADSSSVLQGENEGVSGNEAAEGGVGGSVMDFGVEARTGVGEREGTNTGPASIAFEVSKGAWGV